MNTRNLLLLLAVAGAAYLVLKKRAVAPATGDTEPLAAAPVAPVAVVPVVEEVLHQHEGEDSPIVHAFEEALAEKAGHGDAPA